MSEPSGKCAETIRRDDYAATEKKPEGNPFKAARKTRSEGTKKSNAWFSVVLRSDATLCPVFPLENVRFPRTLRMYGALCPSKWREVGERRGWQQRENFSTDPSQREIEPGAGLHKLFTDSPEKPESHGGTEVRRRPTGSDGARRKARVDEKNTAEYGLKERNRAPGFPGYSGGTFFEIASRRDRRMPGTRGELNRANAGNSRIYSMVIFPVPEEMVSWMGGLEMSRRFKRLKCRISGLVARVDERCENSHWDYSDR